MANPNVASNPRVCVSTPHEKIELFRRELEKESPNPVDAVNFILGIALNQRKVEGRMSGGKLLLEVSGIDNTPPISTSVGMFRSMLARLGHFISEVSRKSAETSVAAPFTNEFEPHPEWRIVSASYQDYPGSPLYNVRGEIVFQNRLGLIKTFNIEMENTGSSHWFLIG